MFALGCSSPDGAGRANADEKVGSAELELTPLTGVTIDAVTYVVTQGDDSTPLRQGIMPVHGDGNTLTIGFALPTGSGYLLSASGVSVQMGSQFLCTGSVGPFSIASGASVPLNLAFTCFDLSAGAADTGTRVVTNGCPELVFGPVSAVPAVASISGSIALRSSAQDQEARPISYLWQVDDPSVANLTDFGLRDATLTCLKLSQGAHAAVTAFNGQCSRTVEIGFACTQP